MDKGFRKFKRKIRLSAILRAVLMGVSLGVVAVAGLWLVAKLTNTAPAFTPDFLRYGLIGGIVALVTSIVFVVLMLPTDKRLAKRLDNKLEMHEKVQTMIAFRKDDSDMAVLQRENAQQLLMQTPTKNARSKRAWLSLILPVVACACMAVAVVVPVQGETPERPVETGWFFSVFDQQKLLDLIDKVQTSGMQAEPKAQVVAELQDLMADLKAINKESTMRERVVKSIDSIHKAAEVCHIHTKVVKALKASASEDVKTLGDSISSLSSGSIQSGMEALQEKLKAEDKAAVAAQLASDLQAALEESGEAEENPIRKALADFAAELAGVTADYTELQVQELTKRAEEALIKAIMQPAEDLRIEKYAINRLMAIFGIPSDSISQDVMDSFASGDINGDPDSGADKEGKFDGGLGSGEQQFGSDDMIYDPIQDKQVVYGEVLNDYQTVILSYMTDGDLPYELEAMVDAYLAILSRSPEDAE